MADSSIWWLLAGVLIAAELLSGTFYLLMLSFGFVAAALSAYAGAPLTIQLVVAALVSGGSVVAWRSYKQNKPSTPPASANHDVNMDIGEIVHVETWSVDATSTVKYRGANWQVSLAPGGAPLPGQYTIIEVVGSRLIVKKI
jgi:membrane protein implicated in regulation of membrane protease activity